MFISRMTGVLKFHSFAMKVMTNVWVCVCLFYLAIAIQSFQENCHK